ncbi:MAG: PhoH family protein [Candidatus Marinimicrobia bacterium]|nr:PhoH family protein [Candidatus Neomarinimicrobiota bacterium]MCF7850838.1 PhoH family protein [Candidatus Neomarinimicrobiota bacterium]MCF7905197.1 PhoH family protein [Candidatus Neomarinimicrobiota bacterium]
MGLTTAKSATEKRLPIREVSPVELYGANDTNLKLIENNLEVKLFVRGDELVVRGAADKVAIVENVIIEMIAVLNRKKFIDKDDVHTIIRLSQSGQSALGETGLDSVVLFTRSDVIKPRTPGQERYFAAAMDYDMVFGLGPAGTGKTYMAVAFAASALKNREVKKIILTRPAVEAGERLGFLPGDLKEKVDPYLAPLYDALYDMMPHDKVNLLLDQKTIEIIPLAYMRGRTLDNAYIILDEAQNTTPMQMKMFLTRMGVNSKIIITGDPSQIDLPNHGESGLLEAVRILRGVEGMAFVDFDEGDIVRHKLVRRILDAYEQSTSKNTVS